MGERIQGTVKWFNDSKGFGFIKTDEVDEIFVFYTNIQMSERGEYRVLLEGETVEFELVPGPRGPSAVDVVRLGIQ